MSEAGLFSLAGRAAVVTGGASGIGAATAEMFAQAGADIVLPWFPGDPHDPEPVAQRIRALGRGVEVIEADVSKASDADRAVATAVESYGRIDIVVANAGILRQSSAEELDDEHFLEILQVDLVGVFRCFRAALPHMREAGYGRLLATSSIAGAVQGWSDHVHYTAAKAGVVGLVRSLALETGKAGITVNAIAPGVVVSPQTQDPVNSLGEAGLAAFAPSVPVGRNGTPEDIAAAFLYLASEQASFMTGQVLVVDGGITLVLV
jgi:3-oxoacyl-[acyl-carrier protein] reductase